MTTDNLPEYNGINFCPRCGFDCRSVGIAMQFSEAKKARQEPSKTPPQPERKHGPARLSRELEEQILAAKADGLSARRVAEKLNLPATTVNYVLYQKHRSAKKNFKLENSAA